MVRNEKGGPVKQIIKPGKKPWKDLVFSAKRKMFLGVNGQQCQLLLWGQVRWRSLELFGWHAGSASFLEWLRGGERKRVRKIETVRDDSLEKLNWEWKERNRWAMVLDGPPMQIPANQFESKDGSVKEDDGPGAQVFSEWTVMMVDRKMMATWKGRERRNWTAWPSKGREAILWKRHLGVRTVTTLSNPKISGSGGSKAEAREGGRVWGDLGTSQTSLWGKEKVGSLQWFGGWETNDSQP